MLDQPPGRCGEDRVDDHVHATQDKRQSPGLSERILKQHREIINHSVATAHLSLCQLAISSIHYNLKVDIPAGKIDSKLQEAYGGDAVFCRQ